MFDSRKKLRKEQIEYLSRIKPILQTASEVQPNENKEVLSVFPGKDRVFLLPSLRVKKAYKEENIYYT